MTFDVPKSVALTAQEWQSRGKSYGDAAKVSDGLLLLRTSDSQTYNFAILGAKVRDPSLLTTSFQDNIQLEKTGKNTLSLTKLAIVKPGMMRDGMTLEWNSPIAIKLDLMPIKGDEDVPNIRSGKDQAIVKAKMFQQGCGRSIDSGKETGIDLRAGTAVALLFKVDACSVATDHLKQFIMDKDPLRGKERKTATSRKREAANNTEAKPKAKNRSKAKSEHKLKRTAKSTLPANTSNLPAMGQTENQATTYAAGAGGRVVQRPPTETAASSGIDQGNQVFGSPETGSVNLGNLDEHITPTDLGKPADADYAYFDPNFNPTSSMLMPELADSATTPAQTSRSTEQPATVDTHRNTASTVSIPRLNLQASISTSQTHAGLNLAGFSTNEIYAALTPQQRVELLAKMQNDHQSQGRHT